MTFIDWIKRTEAKRIMGDCLESEKYFNMSFHVPEVIKGITGISFPGLYYQCVICYKEDIECTCYQKVKDGTISPELAMALLKQKIGLI